VNNHETRGEDPHDILAVDDDPASLQLLISMLKKNGYHVRAASSGKLTLRAVLAKAPDLILLDIKMPDMDGYEVCHFLKAEEKSKDIPIIFISGLGETTQRVQGFNVGCVDYITKPFEPEEVLARVKTHLHIQELASRLKTLNKKFENTIHELASANKELESFSYSVAHDLRNPLKVICGFTDFLIEDYTERLDEEGRDYLEKIKNGTIRMNSIIDDMLVLSKISRQEIEIVDIDMSEMAHLAIKELSSIYPQRTVEVKIQSGLKRRADARLMSVTLGNLLGNAWKYTEKTEHPIIEFGAFENDGAQIFFVKDNGVGFNNNQAGKIFVPFQRLHSEKEFKGTGVGLAIVERAISRLGGKIWAEGEVGKGAVFYFTIGDFSD
jgi:light-regulated signal transduction histidine kinase (bacteriophytochrome)